MKIYLKLLFIAILALGLVAPATLVTAEVRQSQICDKDGNCSEEHKDDCEYTDENGNCIDKGGDGCETGCYVPWVNIVLVNGNRPTHVLAATQLANTYYAPMYYMGAKGLPAATQADLSQRREHYEMLYGEFDVHLFVVGGTGAVSNNTVKRVQNLFGEHVVGIYRIGGRTRFALNRNMQEFLHPLGK